MEGIELRAAIREAEGLVGARLAKAHQVGTMLFLRFFSPPGALALDPEGKAFHRTALRPPTPPEPPFFCRKVRALEGQRLLALEQAGYDRVVRLRFPGGDLVLDLRPRKGNVFLLRGGEALASLREGEFSPAEFLPEGDPVTGLGPSLRRAAEAALGRPPGMEELGAFAGKLLKLEPRGFLYSLPEGAVASFFPRPELGSPAETFPHFWQALDRALEARLSLTTAREYLERLQLALRRKRRALASLEREREEAARWRELQRKADLILARLADIPRGAREAEVEGFDGAPVRLTLDPALPPSKYAEKLYQRARKLRKKLSLLPEREGELRGEIAKLEELYRTLKERPELAPYLEGELAALEVLPRERPRRAAPRPRELEIDGFRILVGRSARENDELTRRAAPTDIWLHARGVPGAHVVIRTGGREVPRHVLERAAELAARHSRARGERNVEVSYTEARYVKKTKGAPPGLVRLLRERVLVVSGEDEN